ncbi:mediator of RNA polymerase II transcription subunit 25-like isoform X1 [Anthonomus grandis grandis]|uniref:mediator of RNA polymerase II transcription subunit 25-like isoform X1 n=1 Tax=Anthonomus grandis grandis TaxID=2921223 RepID=UPI002165FEC2|nr:mediator of RNA polymerase II transcription subunit 25-like isoform X1 [Anthonomus grandis grandis]
MVVCPPEHCLQADVVFLIEATAVNGAYISDIKTNYIIPSLEYFNQGSIDDTVLASENSSSFYGIVTYQAADCLPNLATDTFGPFTSPSKVLASIDRLELIGGKGESHGNIAEGLATALCCFEELQPKRDPNIVVQKHLILICNSPPYMMPVLECQMYSGKNCEQLASILLEKSINLTVISPRKIPPLYKLFEKAGGDLSSSQTKNYAKDPRHLVLLKGYSLKERPVSPPPGSVNNQAQPVSCMPVASMPSPLPGNDSPIHANTQLGTPQNPNMIGNNSPTVSSGMGQSPAYRSPNHPQVGRIMQPNQMGPMGPMGLPMPAPPGYHAATAGVRPGWQMPPPTQQPRPYMPQVNSSQPQVNTTSGGSALIAQLNQPPSIATGGVNVNQFGQINANSPINKILNPQQNIQPSMGQNPGQLPTSMPQVSQNNPVITSQAQSSQPPSQQMGARERHTIWHGVLEWIEKPKNPTDQQKVTKHVPCQVSSTCKDGEPEMKADGWPQKLIMQLMPKQLIGNIGGSYLKNSKSVLFHPSQCEALESLTRVMNSGFAGCVHFTSNPNPAACDIKVLILLYTNDKKAYLGFIPNDQGAFVDRLRKVIQQQKSTQMRQGGNGQPMNPGQPGSQLPMGTMGTAGNNPVTSQQNAQQGMMISQTNTMSMGGGQITQNLNPQGQAGSSLGPPSAAMGQQGQPINQSGQSLNQPGGNIGQPGQPGNTMGQIGQPGNPIGQPGGMMGQNVGQQGSQNQPNMQPGMMGQPVQRAPFENQLQVERQQNLEKINKLKQTLEAAQQQEQQYKTQLERISHMKTSHLQEALQAAQHTEMQYAKILEQRMAAQGNPQVPQPNNPQQQRMIRPVMTNNPGLRHLLQQQPQYRQQILNSMQQQLGNNGRGQMGQQSMSNAQGGQPNQFDDVSNFDFNMM